MGGVEFRVTAKPDKALRVIVRPVREVSGLSRTVSDSLGGLVEMADWLVGLGDMEMAYVQARAGAFTDAEALRECGVPRSTFYDWPKERREYMRNLALERKRDIATQVFQVLEENATAAAEVKAKGLKSRKEHIAQAAADSILDRVLGKPTMRVKQHITGDRVIRLEWPDEGGIPPTTQDPEGGARGGHGY